MQHAENQENESACNNYKEPMHAENRENESTHDVTTSLPWPPPKLCIWSVFGGNLVKHNFHPGGGLTFRRHFVFHNATRPLPVRLRFLH